MLRLAVALSKGLLAGCLVLLAAWFVVTPEAGASPYQHVVDNSTKGRFKLTTKWDLNTFNNQKYGKNYRAARPQKRGQALYKVKTPRTGWYSVCASWPSNRKYNSATPIKIRARGGVRTKRINQRKNGGKWNRIGTYKLRKGDGYKIRVSRNSKRGGWIMADAFKIVRAPDRGGVSCRQVSENKGKKVFERGKKFLGKPYRLGGQAMCDAGRYIDCSCLTQKAYKAVNIKLPDGPAKQWNYGRRVATPRRGDLIFHDENRNGVIDHVSIYAGRGKILHASNYFGKVVISEMKYLNGYRGARRLV